MRNVIIEVVHQHAEGASFLWSLRNKAAGSPNYTLHDFTQIDSRVEANLDGLIIADTIGWEICRESLSQANS